MIYFFCFLVILSISIFILSNKKDRKESTFTPTNNFPLTKRRDYHLHLNTEENKRMEWIHSLKSDQLMKPIPIKYFSVISNDDKDIIYNSLEQYYGELKNGYISIYPIDLNILLNNTNLYDLYLIKNERFFTIILSKKSHVRLVRSGDDFFPKQMPPTRRAIQFHFEKNETIIPEKYVATQFTRETVLVANDIDNFEFKKVGPSIPTEFTKVKEHTLTTWNFGSLEDLEENFYKTLQKLALDEIELVDDFQI